MDYKSTYQHLSQALGFSSYSLLSHLPKPLMRGPSEALDLQEVQKLLGLHYLQIFHGCVRF